MRQRANVRAPDVVGVECPSPTGADGRAAARNHSRRANRGRVSPSTTTVSVNIAFGRTHVPRSP